MICCGFVTFKAPFRSSLMVSSEFSFALPVFVAQEMQYAQVFKKYDAQHIEAF